MKKLFFIVAFLFAGLGFSQEGTGILAKVELVSGVVQYAQFLGINQDTVSLGGNIKGKFTVIKLTKDRFKSIVDEKGNDLLNPVTVPPETADTADTTATDSLQTQTADSSDVTTEEQVEERIPTFLDSVQSKHVFVALERRTVDSVLDAQITPIIIQLLKESGIPLTFARRTDFGYCREVKCIKDSLALYGAASVYQGSISAAVRQDSLMLQVSYTNLQDSTEKVRTAKITLSVFKGLSNALENNKLNNLVKQLRGETIPRKGKRLNYIKMESEPEGATITIPGKDDICKTPCTFATQDTGKFDAYAYWSVNNQIWATKKTILPIPEDTTKISVRLKKVKPELRVLTIPEGAFIYAGSAPLTPNTSPIGKSPDKFGIDYPGTSFIQIRKEGFKDTLVTFFASPTELTTVNVTLEPITNPIEMEQQKQWVMERKKNFLGKVLMGSSVAPILAGALLTYLGSQNYDDAKQIKNELNIPAAFNGENYQAKINENKDLVDKGNRKSTIGGALIGTGVLMLGIGILLTF